MDGHRIAYPQPVTLETSDVILTLSNEGTLALQAAPAEAGKENAAGVVLSSVLTRGIGTKRSGGGVQKLLRNSLLGRSS